MPTKDIVKICASLVIGFVLALLVPNRELGTWVYVLYPLYLLGFVFGFTIIIPWVGKALAYVAKTMMHSIIMKSLLGFVILIVLLPVILMVLLTVGWFIGIGKLIKSLAEAIQGAVNLGSQRRKLRWRGLKRPKKGREKEADYDLIPADDDDYPLLEDCSDDAPDYDLTYDD